jgi:hypothetical protein
VKKIDEKIKKIKTGNLALILVLRAMNAIGFDLEWKLGVRVRFQLEYRDQKIKRQYTSKDFDNELQSLLGIPKLPTVATTESHPKEIGAQTYIVGSTYHEPIATELIFYVQERPIPLRKYHKIVNRTLLSDKMRDRHILNNKPLLPRNVILIVSKRRLKFPMIP